jgi:hypothetical protein
MPPTDHPVKDIVIPLAVVIALLSNALLIGIAWGRITARVEQVENGVAVEHAKNGDQDRALSDLKDRMHDVERDVKETDQRFRLFDDYTRGRIDRLPYKAPPPARW